MAEKHVKVLQNMYEDSETVRYATEMTDGFRVVVGIHQGSALSPFLFPMVMDILTDEVRQESFWTVIIADNSVICTK